MTLATGCGQFGDTRKRLVAQIAARKKQRIPADVEDLDGALKAMPDAQIGDLDQLNESVIAQEEVSATKAGLLHSIPGTGTVSGPS